MKKLWIMVVLVGVLIFGMAVMASADSKTFNFSLGGQTLDQYMDATFGSNVDVSYLQGCTESGIFGGSAAIRTDDYYRGTLDFDPTGSGLPSTFKILSVSFTWGVYDATSGYDFVLDVYNDATSSWVEYFHISDVGDNASGDSGLLVFPVGYEVTGLRIHDSDEHDVGMDNLVINDNRSTVPEPATMLLMGLGLLGLAGARRFRK